LTEYSMLSIQYSVWAMQLDRETARGRESQLSRILIQFVSVTHIIQLKWFVRIERGKLTKLPSSWSSISFSPSRQWVTQHVFSIRRATRLITTDYMTIWNELIQKDSDCASHNTANNEYNLSAVFMNMTTFNDSLLLMRMTTTRPFLLAVYRPCKPCLSPSYYQSLLQFNIINVE